MCEDATDGSEMGRGWVTDGGPLEVGCDLLGLVDLLIWLLLVALGGRYVQCNLRRPSSSGRVASASAPASRGLQGGIITLLAAGYAGGHHGMARHGYLMKPQARPGQGGSVLSARWLGGSVAPTCLVHRVSVLCNADMQCCYAAHRLTRGCLIGSSQAPMLLPASTRRIPCC